MNYMIKNTIDDLSEETIRYIVDSNVKLIQDSLNSREKIIITQDEFEFSLIISKNDPIIVETVDGEIFVNTGILTRPLKKLLQDKQ